MAGTSNLSRLRPSSKQHHKEGSSGNLALTILAVCIFFQTFFIIFSQTNLHNYSTDIGSQRVGNHLEGFEKLQNEKKLTVDLQLQSEPWNDEPRYASSVKEALHNHQRHVKDFERQKDAVIATKIHGRHNLITLEQSLCLLHYAYNKRVQYNIIVFYTDDLDEKDMLQSRQIVKPNNITFAKDSPPLQEVLLSLPEARRQNLMKRCLEKNPNVTLQTIDWWTECPGRINYNWQAEFRAWHIWRHPALAKYKYMLWLDSDGFPTRQWKRDPMAYMINNDLVLFAAAYHKQDAGKLGGKEQQERIFKSFNLTLCDAYERDEAPHVISKTSTNCFDKKVFNFHGYFHLTNLDFYRSEMVNTWSKNWIGDCYLCREYDDQAALTVPALVLAPNKAWTMTKHNFNLGVYHNMVLDGKAAGGFIKLWNKGNNNMTVELDEARGQCEIKAGS